MPWSQTRMQYAKTGRAANPSARHFRMLACRMVAAFLTTLLWAGSVVFAARSARVLGGPAANFARMAVATALLAAWAHTVGDGLLHPAMPWFLLSGFVGFGLGDIGLFAALQRMGPRLTALLVHCLATPVAALFEWLWLGTAMSPPQMVWAVLSLTGVALALAPKQRSPGGRKAVVGIGAALMGAVGQGFGAVVSRKGFAAAETVGAPLDTLTSTYYRALAGIVLIGFVYVVSCRSGRARPPLPASEWRGAVPWVLLNALAGPTLGVACFQWALSEYPSGAVLPIVALTPAVTIPLAWWIEGDRPGARSLAGSAVAIAAAAALAAASG